jgi:SAM-dependent methyltransferase
MRVSTGRAPSSRSYTSSAGAGALLRDGLDLLRGHYARGVERQVDDIVGRLEQLERLLAETYGFGLAGKRVLDLGAGQRLSQLAYFALRGDAVGIDSDVIVQGVEPLGLLRMLRLNGWQRTLKTVARKALLVDRRYRRELARRLGVRRIPRLEVLCMDAARLDFPDESFDLVHSQSVFSHLRDPERVLREIVRVLAPGGVAYVDFLLYTALTGSMDVRALGGGRAVALPAWAHLREACRGEVRESAYLNRIRLPRWRELVEQALPGAQIVLHQPERERLEPEARRLQGAGELLEYDLDELTTSHVSLHWRKPAPRQPVEAASSSDTVTNS